MKRQTLRAVALATLLALLAGCSQPTVNGFVVPTDGGESDGYGSLFGDGKGGGDGHGSSDAGTSDLPPDGTAGEDLPIAQGLLQFAHDKDDFGGVCETLCALLLNQNAVRKIGVRYTLGGQPAAAGTPVEFVLADPQNPLGEVLSGNVFTDDKGEAWTEVKAGIDIGKFSVKARVPDDPSAGELQFDLTVQSKAKGPLQITLHYQGAKSLSEFGVIQARLTQQKMGGPACKSIDLGDTLPAAAWTSPNLKWDKPWTLSFATFPSWVKNQGGEVSFTVVGIAYAATSGAGGKPVAAGCVDIGVTAKVNDQGVVEGDAVVVNVMDIPPRLKGVYDLQSHIDLLSILPDPVELVLKTIFDVMSDPVAGILSLACKLANGSLDSLCGNVFDDPKNPSIKELTSIGGIIVKFLDAILLGFLPDNIKTGLQTGADLGEILTNLEIGGTFEFKAEPDSTGFLPADQTKEVWSTVTYKWSLGQSCNKADPNCGKKTFNIEAFQSEAIVGQFDLWRDAFKSEIKIAKHGLKVKWGALINYIVQKQLLPALTYDPKNPSLPVIDSYDKLIKSLLAGKKCLVKDTCCEEFAAQLSGKQSLLSKDFLSSTCELLVTLGSGYLEQTLIGLDGTTGDPTKNTGLLLAADHCPIFETNQDQLIDVIGGALPKDQCKWDMTLTIGGKPQTIQGIFWATRQQ